MKKTNLLKIQESLVLFVNLSESGKVTVVSDENQSRFKSLDKLLNRL